MHTLLITPLETEAIKIHGHAFKSNQWFVSSNSLHKCGLQWAPTCKGDW